MLNYVVDNNSEVIGKECCIFCSAFEIQARKNFTILIKEKSQKLHNVRHSKLLKSSGSSKNFSLFNLRMGPHVS